MFIQHFYFCNLVGIVPIRFLWVLVFFHRGLYAIYFITYPYCGGETVHKNTFVKSIFPLAFTIFFLNIGVFLYLDTLIDNLIQFIHDGSMNTYIVAVSGMVCRLCQRFWTNNIVKLFSEVIIMQ